MYTRTFTVLVLYRDIHVVTEKLIQLATPSNNVPSAVACYYKKAFATSTEAAYLLVKGFHF